MEYGFRPLFIGGSGRSGTTIVLNLLKDHPQIHASLPREVKYLTSRFGLIDLNFSRTFSLEEDLKGRRNLIAAKIFNFVGIRKEKFFNSYITSSWWSEVGKKGKPRGLVQGITLEQLQSALAIFNVGYKNSKFAASRELFYQLSHAQVKKNEIKYFADSTPVNMMQANYLSKLFPEAKFINMIRDGRDVALSVAKEKWGPNDPMKALSWWANRLLVAHRALLQVRREDQLSLRLEDLIIHNRDKEYKRLLSFLNISGSTQTQLFFDQMMQEKNMSWGLWQDEIKNPSKYNKKYENLLLKLKSQGVIVEKYY
jgi:hypothetical protein